MLDDHLACMSNTLTILFVYFTLVVGFLFFFSFIVFWTKLPILIIQPRSIVLLFHETLHTHNKSWSAIAFSKFSAFIMFFRFQLEFARVNLLGFNFRTFESTLCGHFDASICFSFDFGRQNLVDYIDPAFIKLSPVTFWLVHCKRYLLEETIYDVVSL